MTTGTNYMSPPPQSYNSPPVTIILTVILLVCFFVGFFSIYFCRCFLNNILNTFNLGHSPSENHVGLPGTSDNQGLDPSLVKSFPTFLYSSVKDFRREKYGLECAICLSEFEDNHLVRLLTVCYHVFHQDCIDLWLESHKTCPVCRGNLDLPLDSSEKSPVLVRSNSMHDIHDHERNESTEDAISIVIKDEDGEGRERDGEREQAAPNRSEHMDTCHEKEQRFSRSHSTGHSIIRTKGEEDRYTLRLPEHLKIKIIRGHNWTGSCITFEDFSRHATSSNHGLGEVPAGFQGGNIYKV